MPRCLLTILILFAFVTQGMGGALLMRQTGGGMACCADDSTGEIETACHTQGTSPAASPAATLCCETFCGEGASGSQFEIVKTLNAALIVREVEARTLEFSPGSSTPGLMKSLPPRRHNIPIFLQQSAFLI